MQVKIKKGLDLPVEGAPEQVINDATAVSSVAVIGADYIGMKPTMFVAEGDAVKRGQPLFEDKKNPGVIYTSPGAGTVSAINRGAKRVLQSVVVDLAGDEAEESWDAHAAGDLAGLGAEPITKQLIDSGLWTAFRTRPYSKVPAVDAQPAAIFVAVMDSNPLSPDPQVVIDAYRDDFANGLDVIAQLTQGTVWLCGAPGANAPTGKAGNVQTAEFSGCHPAGLVGTHIHCLEPVSAHKMVWHIGYQDVIAVGKLFTSGKLWVERVISLAGPVVNQPRLLRTRLGANINDLLNGQIQDVEARPISGSIWNGRRANGWAAYLGRYHVQVTVLAEYVKRELFGWLNPFLQKYSVANVYATALGRSKRSFAFNTSANGSPRAMVPIGTHEDVMPLDILATQLLRSIIVRDTDTAQQLGCLELDEEDLALCSFVDVGKYDFGPHLRASLEQIEREG